MAAAVVFRVCALSAVAIAMVLALVEPAQGHAAYSDSDPSNEATVSAPPNEVWAEFTEPPEGSSTLEIYDECGAQVDNGDSRVEAFRIYITMSSATSGTYRVTYRVLSAYDNHVTTGDFTFESTGGESCAGEEEPGPGNEGGSSSSGNGGNGGDGSGSDGGNGSNGDAGGTGGSNSGGSGGGNNGDGSRDGGGGNGGRDGNDDSGGDDGGGIDLARDNQRPEKGLMEGIEWDEFAFALAIAALIGAAGGKVYAGIVGPRR